MVGRSPRGAARGRICNPDATPGAPRITPQTLPLAPSGGRRGADGPRDPRDRHGARGQSARPCGLSFSTGTRQRNNVQAPLVSLDTPPGAPLNFMGRHAWPTRAARPRRCLPATCRAPGPDIPSTIPAATPVRLRRAAVSPRVAAVRATGLQLPFLPTHPGRNVPSAGPAPQRPAPRAGSFATPAPTPRGELHHG